jgi:hyperosmotically inducible periplasmic protein
VASFTAASGVPSILRGRNFMIKTATLSVVLGVGLLAGCSSTPKSPAVASSVRKSLDQAGIKDVSVSEDRDKGVVTLGGHVATDAAKAQAAQIAQSVAGNEVIANEVAVLPPNDSGPTKTFDKDIDKGIDNNLDAALISNGYKSGISHSVKNGVVTLTGTVDTEAQRSQLQQIAGTVPNTQQVVNEIQTRHTKATSNN